MDPSSAAPSDRPDSPGPETLPALAATGHGHCRGDHIHGGRLFLGPMPESVLRYADALKQAHLQGHPAAGRRRGWLSRKWHHTDDDARANDETASQSEEDGDSHHRLPGMRIAHEHALRFFLSHGGRREDWDAEAERSVRKAIALRWHESEWGRIRHRQADATAAHPERWVGATFEVGDVLGVNVLAESHSNSESAVLESPDTSASSVAASTHNTNGTAVPPSTKDVETTNGGETFITAPIHVPSSIPAMTEPSPDTTSDAVPGDINSHLGIPLPSARDSVYTAASTSTSLAPSHPQSHTSASHLVSAQTPPAESASTHPTVPRSSSAKRLKSALLNKAKSDTHLLPFASDDPKGKGTARTQRVHYQELVESSSPARSAASPTAGTSRAQSPAPPLDVLQRSNSGLDETSAGAAASAMERQDIFQPEDGSDVVMRDRMLVRILYSKLDNVGQYDEVHSRTVAHLQYADWAQFLVVWRKDRLEFYEDYSFRAKEWFTGHKKLAFVVPLKDPLKTRVSLYSDVDYTFSLTCPPTPVRTKSENQRTGLRGLLHRAKQGTNIFVCKTKSRSRAADWLWKLWMKLGGEVPATMEVHVPALDRRLKFHVPAFDAVDQGPGYRAFTRSAVLAQCASALRRVPEFALLYEERVKEGVSFELAWRRGMKLDWVWLEEDVDRKPRDWAVLFGLAAKPSGQAPHLEFRLAEHQPSHVRLRATNAVLPEPPSIEGYLYRIRPNSTARNQVYIATHDGTLFFLRPSNPHAPAPPNLDSIAPDAGAEGDAEHTRGVEQVLHAQAFMDLRVVVAVRRAFQLIPVSASESHQSQPEHREVVADAAEDAEHRPDASNLADLLAVAEEERSASDQEDEGGEEGLERSADKPRLRMKRAFELLLKNGHVVRFEAHSRRVALEWITHLRALIAYWGQRHLADAAHEMDLFRYTTGVDDFTTRVRTAHRSGPVEPPTNLEAASLLLGTFWNWCIIDECRAITKAGRIFVRKGLKGQYRYMYLVLASGHLVQYLFTTHTRSMQYPRVQSINLLDAYVCSGRFAAQTLPSNQYDPNAPPVARHYQDGLQSFDADEDTLLMIWYYPQTAYVAPPQTQTRTPSADAASSATSAPRLGSKRHILTLKARSKLERDAWCWALNCEIEKLVRANRDRERNVRETGQLVHR